MKCTTYFKNKVLKKRPYLRLTWIEEVIRNPIRKEVQPDGRIRCWGFVNEAGKYLRVVLEPDGKTVHNAFFDRRFKP